MFRLELFHPISVHFPIVLGVLLPFIKIAELATRNIENKKKLSFLFLCLLTLTLITAFISMYLGDMAYDEVRGQICNMAMVDKHEDLSKNFAIILFIVFAIETGSLVLSNTKKSKLFDFARNIIVSLTLVASTYFLVKAAHSGATLVYDHGVAVILNTKDCQ